MLSFLKKISSFQIFLIIFFLGFLVYFPSLFNGFVADDHVYILENPHITNFNWSSFIYGSSYYSGDALSLGGIYYKPLFTFVVSALYQISGGTPFLFHLTQILLHITNSFLLFILFTKFFRKELSLFLSLIFLLHPGNVESVVYIADLQEPLFFLFGITALPKISKLKNFTWKNTALISSLLLLALLSKESGVLFLPATVALFLTKGKKYLWPTIYLTGGVFLFYLFLRFTVAQVSINHQAIAPIMEAAFYERLLTIPKIIYSYLKLFFFPKDLSWGQHWVARNPDLPNF